LPAFEAGVKIVMEICMCGHKERKENENVLIIFMWSCHENATSMKRMCEAIIKLYDFNWNLLKMQSIIVQQTFNSVFSFFKAKNK